MKKFAGFLFILLLQQSCASLRVNKANKLTSRGVKILDASIQSSPVDNKKLQEAINYFDRSVELDPQGKYAYINRGLAYRYLGRIDLAIAEYDKVIAMYPDDAIGYHKRAIAKQDSGLLKEALSDYLTAKDLNRKDCSVYHNLGTLHYRMDDYPTAIEYYEKATECKPDYAISYLSMGQLYRMTDDYPSALRTLSKAIELEPNNAEAYEERGLVYYKQKKYELALNDLNKAIALSPKSAFAFFYRGLTYRNLDKKDQAQSDFLEAGKLKPYQGTALYNIAMLFSKQEYYSDALEYYDKALQLEKTSAVYLGRGYCNLILKNYEESLKDFNSGVALDSLDVNMLNSRGMAYTYLMKYDSAIVDFKRCIELWPAFLYPYNNMANCYFKLGQTDKACESWKYALRRGYVYNPDWKEQFGIDDPKELVKLHCK